MTNFDTKEIIAFYNVENLFSPDPPKTHQLDPTKSGMWNWDDRRYQNKLFKISQVFDLIQKSEGVLPMLIGLSEIQGQKPLLELVAMSPFNSNYGVIHYDSMDERGVDVALLYDKNKIEITSSEPISYFFEVQNDQKSYYDTTRDILQCKIKYRGYHLTIFVLHLPSKREKDVNKSKRDYILNDLHQKIINNNPEKDELILICGDFNENPDEKNIQNLLFNENRSKTFINPFSALFQNKNFSTYHYKDGLLFDQMILSPRFFDPNSPLKFENAKVFNHPKLTNWTDKYEGRPFRTYAGTRYLGGFSDHFPVITQFSTNG